MKKILFILLFVTSMFGNDFKNINFDGNLIIIKKPKSDYSGERYKVYNLCKFSNFEMERGKFKNSFTIYLYYNDKDHVYMPVKLAYNKEGVFEETLKNLTLNFNGCIYP